MFSCNQIEPMVQVPKIGLHGQVLEKILKEKVVIVLGATGTGKTKLSIGLAEKFCGEIINSDKMQIHEGLDIVTNKVTKEESRGIPHHLLSVIEPNVDFNFTDFCTLATQSMQSITKNEKLPIIVGGSNSFIEALVDYHENMFQPRYEFCCLWVDVAIPILNSTLSDRADQMLGKGLVDEVRALFDPNVDYSKGVYRSIGVPELDQYFQVEKLLDDQSRVKILEEAVNEIKLKDVNTTLVTTFCFLTHCILDESICFGLSHRFYNNKELGVPSFHSDDTSTYSSS
ncbi:RNA processing factor [Lithospermum erythrorhizon]|uniref:RNA processing factor n=1 Tax=Lithospermum erythrorhizon TaxID=34254 RepID=A0AAV3S0Q2_LITER